MYQFHQEQHFYALQQENDRALKSTPPSWVMTLPNEAGFVKLPNERILYTSPPRTSLEISSLNKHPGTEPFSSKSDGGVVYITNQRLVYLSSSGTPALQSFSVPILNLQDTYVRAPFFGANYWKALCKPVAGGGIPPANSAVELCLTFRDGGAFDFHSIFEQLKERLHQAYSVTRESSQTGCGSVNLNDVHLEQLPAYEPAVEGGGRVEAEVDEIEGPTILSPRPVRPGQTDSGLGSPIATQIPKPLVPDEPPPGYEEAQAEAVGTIFEERATRYGSLSA